MKCQIAKCSLGKSKLRCFDMRGDDPQITCRNGLIRENAALQRELAAVKSCVVTDNDDEDSLQAKLDHLLSSLHKKGLDYERMIRDSLARVKHMEVDNDA